VAPAALATATCSPAPPQPRLLVHEGVEDGAIAEGGCAQQLAQPAAHDRSSTAAAVAPLRKLEMLEELLGELETELHTRRIMPVLVTQQVQSMAAGVAACGAGGGMPRRRRRGGSARGRTRTQAEFPGKPKAGSMSSEEYDRKMSLWMLRRRVHYAQPAVDCSAPFLPGWHKTKLQNRRREEARRRAALLLQPPPTDAADAGNSELMAQYEGVGSQCGGDGTTVCPATGTAAPAPGWESPNATKAKAAPHPPRSARRRAPPAAPTAPSSSVAAVPPSSLPSSPRGPRGEGGGGVRVRVRRVPAAAAASAAAGTDWWSIQPEPEPGTATAAGADEEEAAAGAAQHQRHQLAPPSSSARQPPPQPQPPLAGRAARGRQRRHRGGKRGINSKVVGQRQCTQPGAAARRTERSASAPRPSRRGVSGRHTRRRLARSSKHAAAAHERGWDRHTQHRPATASAAVRASRCAALGCPCTALAGSLARWLADWLADCCAGFGCASTGATGCSNEPTARAGCWGIIIAAARSRCRRC
jgi:hypothetical protein